MFTRLTGRHGKAAWLTCLLFVTLALLAACGGAAESVSKEDTTSSETGEVAQASADSEAQISEDQEVASTEEGMTAAEESEATNEEAVAKESTAEETEATNDENSPAPGQELVSSGQAMCHTVTPANDPIAAALQPNPLLPPVSDDEWTRGPADAAITLIEYGDFQ